MGADSEEDQMTLYTDEVKKVVKTAKFPKGFRYDIMEFPLADPPQLRLYIYKDNFSLFPDSKIETIAFELNKVLEQIQNMGVPIILEDRGDKYE